MIAASKGYDMKEKYLGSVKNTRKFFEEVNIIRIEDMYIDIKNTF